MRRAPFVLAVLLLAPHALRAQGENAMPVPKGAIRVSIGADWQHYTDYFGAPNPQNPSIAEGTRVPIGFYFPGDSFISAQLAALAPIRDQIRTLTGVSGYNVNLGRTNLTLNASYRQQPIRIAWAPSAKLGFQVSVPIVRARVSAFIGRDTGAAAAGNVGAFDATVMNTFRTQAEAALTALATQAASGPAALRAQAQAELDAIKPLVCGLANITTPGAASSPCAGSGLSPAAFLPLGTSEAGDSITARLTSARNSYAALAAQYSSAGSSLPAFSAPYTLPSVALDSTALRAVLGSATLGGDTLTEVVRTGIGDIEVGGWLQLANSPSLRSQAAVTVRLPTGKTDTPGNLIDLGTGDHQTDVEVALRNDIVLGGALWLHAGGRYGIQMSDQLTRRVTPYYLPLVPASAEASVNRKLGNYYGIDLVPNWQLDDAFNVGLGFHYFHQNATTYSYVNAADEATIGLPASVLGLGTGVTRARIGGGVTFSTLQRYMQGRAKLPYRVTWSYNSTLYGRGGQVPRAGVMMLEIQAFFGHLR